MLYRTVRNFLAELQLLFFRKLETTSIESLLMFFFVFFCLRFCVCVLAEGKRWLLSLLKKLCFKKSKNTNSLMHELEFLVQRLQLKKKNPSLGAMNPVTYYNWMWGVERKGKIVEECKNNDRMYFCVSHNLLLSLILILISSKILF